MALVIGLGIAAPIGPVAADPAAPTAGRVLPWVPQDARYGTRLALFSPDLVGVSRQTYRPGIEPPLDIRSTVDGSVVAQVPTVDYSGQTSLSGHTLLRTPGYASEPRQVVATDVVTGEALWTIDVPAGESIASVGESWVLSATVDNSAVLRRPGTPERTVEGLTLTGPTSAGPMILGDPGGLLVTNGGSPVYEVDLDAGTARVLVDTGSRTRMAASTTRWFAVTSDYSTGTYTVAWWDRQGSASGSVTLPGADDYYAFYAAYGDGLVKVSGGLTYSVDPVDLVTGQLGAPLLSDAAEVRPLGDGRLVAHLTDTPNGRVVLLEDGKPQRTLVDLPEIGRPAKAVMVDGGRVVTGYGYPTEGESWSALPTGDAAPTRLTDVDGAIPGALFDVEGGTVLTRTGESSDSSWVVSWPGGRRTLSSPHLVVSLGAGGRVVRRDPLGPSVYEDARTGAALGPAAAGGAAAVDGTTEWTGPDATGSLTGRDLVSGATRVVETGLTGCTGDGLTARGRWVLAHCRSAWQVIDVGGVLRPRTLAAGIYAWPLLGDGFVSWLDRSDTTSDLVTQDLGVGFTTRTYAGPVAFDGETLAPATDEPRVAFLDDAHLARMIDLGWLSTTPDTVTDDTVGPQIVDLGGSPPQTNQTLFAQWSAEDTTASTTQVASGVATYDVRYQQPLHQKPPTSGGWLVAAWSTNLTATRVDLPATAGRDTCWSVRARDRAGNVGPWSSAQCVYHDTVAPLVTAPTAGPRVVAATTKRTVTFTFQVGTDGQDWNTTDSAYRLAPSGAGYGAWVKPATWTNASAASQRLSVSPGQDVCFMARARDLAGNIGPWSRSACTSVPYDDRSLSTSGSARRTTSSLAISGTTTTLSATGAKAYRTSLTGTKVAVLALRGPGQGTVDVYVGSRKVGRVSLAASTWSRTTVTFSTGSFTKATVSLRSVSSKPSRIDALAVLRS